VPTRDALLLAPAVPRILSSRRHAVPVVSLRKYAEHRGVSHTAVQKAVKQGRIQTTAEGRIDVEQADAAWDRNSSPVTGAVRAGRPERPAEPATSGPSYAQSRAVRELYLARLARIEFEERSGKLVSRDEVTVAAFTTARTIRDNLLNIPDRLAATLAAEMEPSRVHEILTEEIRKALSELSTDDSIRDL
jgi:hypothetical protein